MVRTRSSPRDSPRLHSPHQQTPSPHTPRPGQTRPTWPICTIIFLAITAYLCILLALAGTVALIIRKAHQLARKAKRKLTNLLKQTAIFTVVMLTIVVLGAVEIANALERDKIPDEHSKANPHPARPQEDRRQSEIREYSRSLYDLYLPRIEAFLDETPERASYKRSTSGNRVDSVLHSGVEIFDLSAERAQETPYFANWECYHMVRRPLRSSSTNLERESDRGDGEYVFNPWRTETG